MVRQTIQLSPNRPHPFVDNLLMSFLLVGCNEQKSSSGAVSRQVLLATMKAQQAVAIRFVGRRVIRSTCLFFSLIAACPCTLGKSAQCLVSDAMARD
jgi:hypothetical protein